MCKYNDEFIERYAKEYQRRDNKFKKEITFETFLKHQADVDKIMKKLFLKETAVWHV